MPGRPINELEAMIGDSVVTTTGLTVEAGKVEEFARALRDDNPAHRSAEAADAQGYDRVPAPLTFIRTAKFPRYTPDDLEGHMGFEMAFDRGRTVHGEQEYEFHQPIRVGDTLTGTTTMTNVYQRESSGGGVLTFVVLETEFVNQEGESVITARKTRIETPPADGSEGENT